MLRIGVAEEIGTLDPLFAEGRAERLAARQVHEPLVSRQAGPFEQTRRRPGLARSMRGSAGETIWTARLRRGVRFQSGEPFDAGAVIANADRWLIVAPELVPGLIAADSPRPGLVRFLLDQPDPDFPRLLASTRLGIVATNAVAGAGMSAVPPGATGTGPFEFRGREADGVLLARNAAWWGTGLGLGPGVDQIELIVIPAAAERVDDLVAGSIEVADELSGGPAREVGRDPLLGLVRSAGAALGIERSVRGLDSASADQPLADVWLTDLG